MTFEFIGIVRIFLIIMIFMMVAVSVGAIIAIWRIYHPNSQGRK